MGDDHRSRLRIRPAGRTGLVAPRCAADVPVAGAGVERAGAVTRYFSLVIAALMCLACSQAPEFDLVITGGTVFDGTGTEPRRVDLGIKGDRIVAIGNLTGRAASESINATGKTVAPGFIDLLSRSGIALLAGGLGESHLRQGITSEILGDHSPAFWTAANADQDALRVGGVTFDWSGLNGYFNNLESRGTTINVGTLAPSSLARGDNGGTVAFVDAAIRDGALGALDDAGLSTTDLAGVAAAVGRADTLLVIPVESTAATSDDALFSTGGLAHRIIINGVSRAAAAGGAGIAEIVGRLMRANQRSIGAYGTIVPSPQTSEQPAMRDTLRYSGVIAATDSAATTAAAAPPNAPSAAFGAFPRLLGQIVRDEHVMELREAISRSSFLPASMLKIAQRGII